MARITTLWWRDIPAQVIAGAGRRAVKVQLSPRFAEAIDRAAMRAGLAGEDDYLAAWRRLDEGEGGDAEARAAALEAEWPRERLHRTALAGGIEAHAKVEE